MNFDRLGETSEDDLLLDGPENEAGIADDFGFGEGEGGRRRVGEGTLVIIGALLIAAGALYGMRWLGHRGGSAKTDSTLEARVIAFLEGFVDGSGGSSIIANGDLDPQAIMSRLADDRTQKQVPLTEVKKNPFIRPIKEAEVIEETVQLGEDPEEIARRLREKRFTELDRVSSGLLVSSIMGREGNRVAVVEGEVVGMGDQIVIDESMTFEISRIEAFDVFLTCEGFSFMISLER